MHDSEALGEAPTRLRVLVLDDRPPGARPLGDVLGNGIEHFDLVHATHVEDAASLLRDPSIDAILVELQTPDACGARVVASALAGSHGPPVLVIADRDPTASGLELARLGAQDLLHRDELTGERLRHALGLAIERQRLVRKMRDNVLSSLSDGENLRRLLLGATEALVVVGDGGAVRYANETAESLFGWPPGAQIGKPFGLPFESGLEVEQEIRRDDGSVVVAEMRITHVRWRDECARLVSLRDVSERRRAADRQMRLDILTGFLGNVSHELRTPLAAIYQFVSNVGDGILGPVNEDQEGSLRAALRNVDEVLAMIANLLEVARSQAGKLRIEPQVIHLAQETHRLFDVLRASARERGLKFSGDIPTTLPPVLADPTRVRQILTNLVDNALKFTHAPGSVRIHAELEPGGERVLIRVSDTGCGVPPEHAERIFEQLHQVPDSLYRSRRGLGLGLFITRELVRALNGEIRLRSEMGKGASFDVLLPVFSLSALLEPLATEVSSRRKLMALRVRVGWLEGDPSEPLPDSTLWDLNDRIQSSLGGRPHRVLPRVQVGSVTHLGAILSTESSSWPSVRKEIRARLRLEPGASESAVKAIVDFLPLTSEDHLTPTSEIESRLSQYFLQPSQGEAACHTTSAPGTPGT